MKKMLLILALALGPGLAMAATPTNVSTVKILRSGVSPTASAIDYSNGNSVSVTAGEFLVIESSSVYLTVTATDQRTSREGYTNNATCFVPVNTRRLMGPFVKNRWADSSGLIEFTYSATTTGTGATIWALRLPFG